MNAAAAEWLPADYAARRNIIERVEESMCVEAGAGTGKTSVLVDRIVEILRRGHARVDELVVITFTEKAASELAARVRRGLEKARAMATIGEERQRLDDGIRGLNAAHIETIHAFAASLLRERPVEAGLDPGFEVLDELPAQLSFEAAYNDWVTEQLALDVPPPALVDALGLGMEYRLVREAASRLNRHRDALPLAPYHIPHFSIDDLLEAMRREFAFIEPWVAQLRNMENVTFTEFQRMRAFSGEIIALQAAGEPALPLIATTVLPDTQNGNKKDWRDSSEPKNSLIRLKSALAAAQAAIKQGATARLMEWAQGFVHFYNARRKAEGTADFDDLLIWARDLVRTDAGVRAHFQSKYRCILVDEFQDTDPLQAEMIIRLCAEGDPGSDWRRARLRPGSLFAVGDPKQSIYRFRRADITMYDDVKRQVFGGATAEITQNFRSSAPIIAWVNTLFEQLILEHEGVQPRYIGLHHHPAYDHGGVDVLRGTAPSSSGSGVMEELRRAEAQAIASLIQREVAGGAWSVREGDGEQAAMRPATYHDVAVLIPSRTDLYLYEDALTQAGIPHRHEGGRTFFRRQEVRELIAILRAIDDPTDQVGVIAALRSPAFACSDEDLFLHRRKGGRFDYMSLRNDAEGVVADSLRALRDLASRRFVLTLPELVRCVIDGLRLVEFAMLQHQGSQAAANLLKIIDQARAFGEARRAAGLRGFVRWLKENVTRDSDETDAAITEETDDVVRIVTVHASKGLEFGVVVFANMNTQRSNNTNIIVSRDEERGAVDVRLGDAKNGFCTPAYEQAEADEKLHSEAEQLRLLYVAATRARDHLVVPFFQTEGKPRPNFARDEPKCLNDYFRRIEADLVEDVLDASELPVIDGDMPAFEATLDDASPEERREIIEKREGWQAARGSIIAEQMAGLRVLTATSLKKDFEAPTSSEYEIRRGKAADFGTAVHEVLDRVDLRRPEDIPALAARIAATSGLSGREQEMEVCARNVLGHDVIRRALSSPRLLREVAFTAPLPDADDGGLAEGRIDLLFVEAGEIVVVDFKTDAVTESEVAARSATYRSQALVYAWAAAQATGMPVREVILLYARLPDEHRFIVDEAFLAEADRLLREPVSPLNP